ncbi:hypothetical protein K1T71_001158 [Dendrolimus kikuchii]|uniref:Uncharacterized protein n=1 Tax=Dendrolimus kikuchii TaxID=765133 RepID=A0ACC1DH17_9NEOP|nr:hypothetical protein K1T71_001158 [Dendrolimus kikuchii]
MIIEQMPRFFKPLKHVVVLVDMDHHSLNDLARLVIWNLVAGVPYLSLFDTTGELYEHEEKLFYEVEKLKKGVPGCVKWANKLPDLNGYTNGNSAHTLVVNIFRHRDGRKTVVECVQQIAEGSLVCKRNSREFTAEELDEALSQIYPAIPDPDMALYTGCLCSTKGLLPWQIRLTVFVQLSTDHSINVDQYLGAIHKYSKCDQRFGK